MKIIRANVIHQPGAMDLVVLHADLPSPCPALSAEPLSVCFHTEIDKGAAYLEANFPGVPVTVTDYNRALYSPRS